MFFGAYGFILEVFYLLRLLTRSLLNLCHSNVSLFPNLINHISVIKHCRHVRRFTNKMTKALMNPLVLPTKINLTCPAAPICKLMLGTLTTTYFILAYQSVPHLLFGFVWCHSCCLFSQFGAGLHLLINNSLITFHGKRINFEIRLCCMNTANIIHLHPEWIYVTKSTTLLLEMLR